MIQNDVIIVGGGVAGLSAALLLASAGSHYESAIEKKILIFDTNKSDALKAKFLNVPGMEVGISGTNALLKLRDQVLAYPNVKLINSEIQKIEGEKNNFILSDNLFGKYATQEVILASGFREFLIKGINFPITQFLRTTVNTRVALEHTHNIVFDGIRVCGLLANVSSQWAIVAGSGQQVAIDILSEWEGKWSVVHDKMKIEK